MPEQLTSVNFSFLAAHDPQLVRLGALAERYFKDDPTTSLIKLRQYGETLAQLVAAKVGLFGEPQEPQADLLRRLKFDGVVPREVGELFHHLRLVGNRATHEHQGSHTEALTALKVGRELGIWFHRTFGAVKTFSPGTFVPPRDPSAATRELAAELSRLRAELDSQRTAAERAQIAAATVSGVTTMRIFCHPDQNLQAMIQNSLSSTLSLDLRHFRFSTATY